MYNHPQSRLPSELKTLSSWGFPQSVVRKYNSKGVVSLFPWQIECLLIDNAAPLEGRSLLYTAPTRLVYIMLYYKYYIILYLRLFNFFS